MIFYKGNRWGVGRAMRGNGRHERFMEAQLHREVMQDAANPEATLVTV